MALGSEEEEAGRRQRGGFVLGKETTRQKSHEFLAMEGAHSSERKLLANG